MVGIYDGATGAIRSAGWRRRDGDGCGLHSTMAVDRPAPGSPCDGIRDMLLCYPHACGEDVGPATRCCTLTSCYPHACGEDFRDSVFLGASCLVSSLPA